MKFRVAREDLADAVAWVARSLPARPPVPVLGGILLDRRRIDALGVGLRLRGVDPGRGRRSTR